jgi:hypothetical protein
VGLERDPLKLVSINELKKKKKAAALEIRKYGCRDPLCSLRNTLYPQKLALTSAPRGCRLVGIVRSRNKATKFVCCSLGYLILFQLNRLRSVGKDLEEIVGAYFKVQKTLTSPD